MQAKVVNLVGTRQISDSGSEKTAIQFSRPQEYRSSEYEPEHTARHNKFQNISDA